MCPATATDESAVVDCALVVVTYNSADTLPSFFASLPGAATTTTLRTVVIDNGSSDGTLDVARRLGADVVIEAPSNLGYAGGVNLGRREVVGSAFSILVLNPDLTLADGAVDALVGALREGAGAAVPRLVDREGRTLWSLRRDPSIGRTLGESLFGSRLARRPAWLSEEVRDAAAYSWPHPVDWATGAALAVSCEVDGHVGDWDETFFMYSEEVDIAQRIRALGFDVQYVPDAVASHAEGGSGRNDQLGALLALNRVRLYRKRHGRFATAAFRLMVALGEALRAISPRRRLGLRVVLGLTAPPNFSGAAPIAEVPW